MNGWLALLTGVLALLGTVLTTWITQRFLSKRAKSDDTQKLIDQLQEERDAADKRRNEADRRHIQELAGVRAELTALRTEVGEARHEIDEAKARAERRELVFFDYAAALRWHIDQGKGPPPPPWPAALMNRD